MRAPGFLLVGLASALLCGCASVGMGGGKSVQTSLESEGDVSSYGQYLAGQAAVNHADSASAEAYFSKAAGMDPADRSLLTTRAFTSALLAGDITQAAALAPTGPDADNGLRHLGALVRAVEALSTNKAKLAHAILTGPDAGAPNEPAAALLTPFAAAAAGDPDGSIVHPVISGEPVAQFFANLDQGKLFERARRYDEAETAFRALIAKGDPGGIASLSLGEMLERRGRSADAVGIYDTALGAKKDAPELAAARARAAGHKPAPPAASLRTIAAEALIAPATALLSEKQEEIALAYLRLAVRLDPSRDEAWLLVGDVLDNNGDASGARGAYAKVKPGATQYTAARIKLAWSHQGAGDKEAALAAAHETVGQRPTDEDAQVTLADLLRADERYDESAKVLDGLIAAKGDAVDWKLLYMRAVDYEESNRWADAERDLQTALKKRPNEPELLNFLGYSWIDRGVKLPEAISMVEKAVNLQPQSGAMIDSLGWGYFRLGNYPAAVDQLEKAIVLEPGDPDVNNHLGDAYWKVGRKVEADFQWRRVLTLDPTPKLKAEVQAKLASGLDRPGAPVVAVK
ncbi:MAG: Tetratricopeptide 2 repeat protein [Caulobacteraceae bacterium]|nr:Tetratricopeptide 2 repeat protein [Caulobacteraceae bacterium]